MKVLQINKYYQVTGGTDTVFLQTVDLLRERGVEVIPWSLNLEGNLPAGNHYFVDYPEVSKLSWWKKIKHIGGFLYNREAKKKLELLIENERPDVAHIHLMFNSLSIAILPTLKRLGIPVVMTLHEYRLLCPSYLFLDRHSVICERCSDRFYFRCALRRCSKGSFVNSLFLTAEAYLRKYVYPPEQYIDRFLCVSHFLKDKYSQYNSRIGDKCSVLYNPIRTIGDRSLTKNGHYLYVGRLSREKGLHTLLGAFQEFPHLQLKIVGSGELKQEIQESKPSNVELLGYCSGDHLSQIISEASFLIIPSEWYETFGLVVLEAFRLGTPVIASAIGGITELVDDNRDGFLYHSGEVEALKEAISRSTMLSSSDYDIMVEAALKRSAQFDNGAYTDELLSIYQSLIDAKQRGGGHDL